MRRKGGLEMVFWVPFLLCCGLSAGVGVFGLVIIGLDKLS